MRLRDVNVLNNLEATTKFLKINGEKEMVDPSFRL